MYLLFTLIVLHVLSQFRIVNEDMPPELCPCPKGGFGVIPGTFASPEMKTNRLAR